MKVRVCDLCVVGENCISEVDEKELFEYENGNWDSYLRALNDGCIWEEERIDVNSVDRRVFIINDGGELFRLKDGKYMNVCWRGGCCRVWEEEDEELIEYLDKKLK